MSLRIGHVITSIGDLAAGPAQGVPAICNALAKLGHHVELHALDTGGATRRAEEHYQLFAYPYWRHTERLGISPKMQHGLHEAAKRLDIMHWHSLWKMPNVYPAWAVRGTDCKLVFSPRGTLERAALRGNYWVKRLAWYALQRQAASAASLLHATSEGELLSMRRAGLHQEAVLVENGIAVPSAALVDAARRSRSQRRKLLYLGRINRIKGLDRLLAAWRRIQGEFPDWDLDLVGPDYRDHREELSKLAVALGVERLSFSAPVFEAERDAQLAGADLYVLASHSENFAMSVAESLAAGTPVVCSRGAPWARIEEKRCGVWVENSEHELARGLRQMMSCSRSELMAMGDSGRAWMQDDFAWEAKARALEAAYARMVHMRGVPEIAHDRASPTGAQ